MRKKLREKHRKYRGPFPVTSNIKNDKFIIYRISKKFIRTKERDSVSVSEQISSGDTGYGRKSLETIATGNKSGYLYGVFGTNDRKI